MEINYVCQRQCFQSLFPRLTAVCVCILTPAGCSGQGLCVLSLIPSTIPSCSCSRSYSFPLCSTHCAVPLLQIQGIRSDIPYLILKKASDATLKCRGVHSLWSGLWTVADRKWERARQMHSSSSPFQVGMVSLCRPHGKFPWAKWPHLQNSLLRVFLGYHAVEGTMVMHHIVFRLPHTCSPSPSLSCICNGQIKCQYSTLWFGLRCLLAWISDRKHCLLLLFLLLIIINVH